MLTEEKYISGLNGMNNKTPAEIENMAREALVRKNGGKNPWDPQPAAPAQGGNAGKAAPAQGGQGDRAAAADAAAAAAEDGSAGKAAAAGFPGWQHPRMGRHGLGDH